MGDGPKGTPVERMRMTDRILLHVSMRALTIARWLKRTFPQRKVKQAFSITILCVLGPLLMIAVTALLVPVLIWDLIDPWGIDVGWPLYLFFLFLYISAGYLVYMVIEDTLDLLDIVYQPFEGLVRKTASVIIGPFVKTMKKTALALAVVLTGIEIVLLV
jgi:hypothetical protein